ncbi:MAG: DedA family protein [Bdellovibrionales bacterium]|nr:DedA family protein [Bdellovibrionales bacterium]MBT3527354.1 DedA family protein [Bdellovibrionales bacterium]MBT7767639.1 DedA family protein [Bdellovibrionales bacterium]
MGGLLKRAYNRILASCDSMVAPYLLGFLSFTESCCFIIPPEVMLLPMSYANRTKALWYALITTIASVLGAVAGYYLGAFAWEEIQPFVFENVPGFAKHFDHVGNLYQENAVSALLIAAFTPIPFKVFTVAAGVYSTKISVVTLIVTSLVGRGCRYYLMAFTIYLFGERAQKFIEQHLQLVTIVVGILIVLVAVAIKFR